MHGRPRKAWPYVTAEIVIPLVAWAAMSSAETPPWIVVLVLTLMIAMNLIGWTEGRQLESERPGTRVVTAAELAERIQRGEQWELASQTFHRKDA